LNHEGSDALGDAVPAIRSFRLRSASYGGRVEARRKKRLAPQDEGAQRKRLGPAAVRGSRFAFAGSGSHLTMREVEDAINHVPHPEAFRPSTSWTGSLLASLEPLEGRLASLRSPLFAVNWGNRGPNPDTLMVRSERKRASNHEGSITFRRAWPLRLPSDPSAFALRATADASRLAGKNGSHLRMRMRLVAAAHATCRLGAKRASRLELSNLWRAARL
jgi:hypothetical protein